MVGSIALSGMDDNPWRDESRSLRVPKMNSREEHLEYCKQSALEYVDIGDLRNALVSLGCDLNKHPETAGHIAIELGTALMTSGQLNTPEEMRNFINGFN